MSSRARRQRGHSRACWKCRRLSEKTACCGRNRRGRAGERRVAPRLDPRAARAHAGDSTGFRCPASLHPRAPDSARGPGRWRLLSSSHRCTVAPKPARWRAGRWQWVAALPTRRPPPQPSPAQPRHPKKPYLVHRPLWLDHRRDRRPLSNTVVLRKTRSKLVVSESERCPQKVPGVTRKTAARGAWAGAGCTPGSALTALRVCSELGNVLTASALVLYP